MFTAAYQNTVKPFGQKKEEKKKRERERGLNGSLYVRKASTPPSGKMSSFNPGEAFRRGWMYLLHMSQQLNKQNKELKIKKALSNSHTCQSTETADHHTSFRLFVCLFKAFYFMGEPSGEKPT